MKVNKNVYNKNFYDSQRDGSYQSAQMIIPIVLEYISPKNVIDVGCGLGTWLKIFKEKGIDIMGIDGDYVSEDLRLIDNKEFISMDLRRKFEINKKFDLVMTLEVVEHLPPERGEGFIQDIIKLGDVVLFSAAVPYQGGEEHINEKRLSEWEKIFKKFNYIMIDCIRSRIWNETRIEPWYKQNIVFFVRRESIEKHKKFLIWSQKELNLITDIIHPDLFEKTVRNLRKRKLDGVKSKIKKIMLMEK